MEPMQSQGYHDVPYRGFIAALSFPCTIGTAISAPAAFSVISASSLFGDSSPKALATLRRMAVILAYSAGCCAIATTIVVCLQFLYSGPSFCKIITQKKNFTPRLRRKDRPHDLLRSILAHGAVGLAYLAAALEYAGTILLIEALSPFVPALAAQILITLIAVGCLFTFTIAVALENDKIWNTWRSVLCGPWDWTFALGHRKRRRNLLILPAGQATTYEC